VPLCTKFDAENLINGKFMPRKRNSKWRPPSILDLLPVAIFNILPFLHYHFQPPYKISCKYLNPRLNYNNVLNYGAHLLRNQVFEKNKIAAVRYLVFSKTSFLSNGFPSAGDFPSLYQIWCKNVDQRRNYGIKSKSKMAAVRHLGFRHFIFVADLTWNAYSRPQNFGFWGLNP